MNVPKDHRMNDDLSYSGQHSGWQDYAGADWNQRKPINWLHDWDFWQYCVEKYADETPILELACGNGRITRQLLLAGYAVVAVDINPHFLSQAQQHTPAEYQAQVDFYCQDVVHLTLDRQFQVVLMADWAFPSLLTQNDQRQFLERLAAHMRPGGIFAFNTIWGTPRQIGLALVDGQLVWPDENRQFDALTQIETKKSGDYVMQYRHNTLDEIKLLGELAGFKIIEQYGWVDRRPLRGLSDEDLTLILQKQG